MLPRIRRFFLYLNAYFSIYVKSTGIQLDTGTFFIPLNALILDS